jgi:dTDP-4-dehydrorhamnose reductase
MLIETCPQDVEAIACTHVDLDVTDASAVRARLLRERPALIVNAAAYTAVDKAESEPEAAHAINAEGPRQLAAAAGEIGARLIHLSTDFVFDGTSSTPYRPDAPTNPLSVYGRTKRDGEAAVCEALPERAVILRTAWVYAAHGANFMHTMLRLMRSRGEVGVVADQVGTPSAARPLAEALWQIAARPGIHGVHHWTDAGVASWYDFAVAIAEEGARLGLLSGSVCVRPIATEQYPTAARRPAYSVLDKRSLASLGLAPRHWRVRLREVMKELAHA